MAYDLERLASYVRFYLTVVTQLGAAWENIARTHAAAKEALAPFAEPLAAAGVPALAGALSDGPDARAALAALFRPEDPERLSGLNDIYEVVGRFGFQGEDNENLGSVQALVSGARNAIMAQRGRLEDLGRLPALARAVADRLEAEEARRAEIERAEKAAAFEPLALQVAQRAEQTVAAMRAVPSPDLEREGAAADEYKRFTGKLDQVYQTCLPFLRRAIGNLYAFVGCEPGASFPDALPLVHDLPAELVTVPPADSPELSQARDSLRALGEEELGLGRARDAVGTAIARLEGELAAAQMKDKEIEIEIGTAGQVVDLAALAEQAEAARAALPGLEQQRAERVKDAGEALARKQKAEAQLRLLEGELAARGQEIAALEEQRAALQGDEPVLFGKDAWRSRVAELDKALEALRAAAAQQVFGVNQLKIELAALSVQVQTEETQRGLVEQRVEATLARLTALRAAIREAGAALGASRPARAISLAEAEQAVADLQAARVELAARAERLREEMRQRKDEGVRMIARLKQIAAERQHAQAMVQSAQVAATSGREEALRQLTAQRRAAVERHVSEVLGGLEKSLGQVALLFIEPAREAMLKSTAPRGEAAAAVRAGAEAIAPVIDKLARELGPELLAEDAALGQIQREFCDVAASACRAAWG